jgi:hypothetical protein
MTSNEQKDFIDQLEKLQQEFEQPRCTNETDEELADASIDYILRRERLRRGVTEGGVNCQIVDSETLEKMRTWDTDDPEMSAVEKVFRRLASKKPGEGVKLLKAAITSRAQAVSEEQRRKAKKPRQRDPLTKIIRDIVSKNSAITVQELELSIRREIHRGIIYDIDDGEIIFCDAKIAPVNISALKDRLSRAKKTLSR